MLGWIAEKYPELVRRISDAGHEVASRGFLHQPLLKLSEPTRREDLHRSKALLFGFSKMKTVRTIASHLRLLSRVAAQRFGRGGIQKQPR